MRLLRSYLFAPGNHPRLLQKAFEAGADGVVLDLEDAVPEAEKASARRQVAAALANRGASSAPGFSPAVFVRVNELGSAHWRADVDAAVCPEVRGLRAPKVESLERLCQLNDAISRREEVCGIPLGSTRVIATIESARGVALVATLARAPRLSAFTFGAADFCADIGGDGTEVGATLFARSSLVVASRHARLAPPVASVYTNLEDDDGLRTDTEAQKKGGFFGRSAIHPRQLPIIHAVFDPTAVEVARARRAILAYEEAGESGRGVSMAAGEFVDLAIVRRARAIIELHETLGKDAK